jgi:hypothetical protein
MQAMYIGFANKDTYLTQLFKEYKASEAFGSSSDEDNANNTALKSLGKDLFKDFQVTNLEGDYNLNPKRIFSNDDNNGTAALKIRFIPEPTLKEFAINNAGTITSSLRLIVTYKGRAGGGTGGGFAMNEEVFRDTLDADFNMSSLKNGVNVVTYSIKNPTYDIGKPWDTSSNAKYKIEVVIYYHLVGSAGGDTYAEEVATASNEMTWNQTWFLANSLNATLYSEDQIKEIVDGP